MDVGNPSNFVRILEIMQHNFASLTDALSSYSYDDTATEQTIARVYQQYDYTLDPHGAVAYLAAEAYTKGTDKKALILETAHPVKFPEVVERAIHKKIEIPASVQFLLDKQKVAIPMQANFKAFKEWMLN
jgi:threonine synthase